MEREWQQRIINNAIDKAMAFIAVEKKEYRIKKTYDKTFWGMRVQTGGKLVAVKEKTSKQVYFQPQQLQQVQQTQGRPGTWYYILKESGGPHAFAYDPNNNIIYEVNHPQNSHGLVNWLEGLLFSPFGNGMFFSGKKSVAYQWNMNNKNDVKAFWARGQGTLYLSPVTVTNPAAATAWFQSKNGTSWDYNLITNNCMHYVIQGLNAGGAGLNGWYGSDPANWPGAYTMSWSGGQYPTMLPYPVRR